jgi:hypothetical protein
MYAACDTCAVKHMTTGQSLDLLPRLEGVNVDEYSSTMEYMGFENSVMI